MTIIYEVVVKQVLPILKGILANTMRDRGYSQRKIAQLLNITQPQVHKYLSKDMNHYLEKARSIGLDIDKLKYYVNLVIEALERSGYEKYVLMLNSIVNDLAINYACRTVHELREICYNGRLSDPHIEYYRNRVEKILEKYDLVAITPEVGMNIVYAPTKPRSPVDVIGLSGRIIRASDRVVVVGEPMYGGSRHLARVLIMASKYARDKHVAMNTTLLPNIEKYLPENIRVLYSGPHSSIEEFWETLGNIVKEKPDIIVDLGGYGLEPVTYLITRDFDELENLLNVITRIARSSERK
ncbi:MAG: thiamine-phosphate synthase family protein [Thermoprotei archaeon]